MERPDPCPAGPFSFQARADGSILVRYREAPVRVLRGKAAERFATRMNTADADAAQQLMARVTGNFMRRNEHDGKRSPR
jgi:hypothetical protein